MRGKFLTTARLGVFPLSAVALGYAAATLLSGIPSTLYAWVTAGDLLEATRAAGAMLLPNERGLAPLLIAAAVVHCAVSLFWTLILAALLPARHTVPWAVLASAVIALLALKVIAPAFFPAVAELAFWPQFADHLAWGACLGLGLSWGLRRLTRQAS